MFYKIKKIEPIEKNILKIYFENGDIKYYDIKIAIKKVKQLELLNNNEIFKKVKVGVGGYGAVWSNDLDIDCNELYINGKDKL